MSHLVRQTIEVHGAIPICPVHEVEAAVQGQQDPGRWGHLWSDPDGTQFWCVSQVLEGGGDGPDEHGGTVEGVDPEQG